MIHWKYFCCHGEGFPKKYNNSWSIVFGYSNSWSI